MSITTGRGDDGFTDLLFGRRVPKTHPRVEAAGAVDELNAALGIARTLAGHERTLGILSAVQEDLIALMGELARLPEDASRHAEAGFRVLSDDDPNRLAAAGRALEEEFAIRFRGWSRPGAARDQAAAHIDFARTVCRRAERVVLTLRECPESSGGDDPALVRHLVYLNRLSDVLWLLARHEEAGAAATGEGGATAPPGDPPPMRGAP